jgi:23S rRNA (guanosine2251-2'-O)-methyltransferase
MVSKRKSNLEGHKKKSQGVWLWGMHSVEAALKNPRRTCFKLALNRDHPWKKTSFPPNVLCEDLGPSHVQAFPFVVHQGVMGLFSPLEPCAIASLDPHKGPLLVLDHILDPQNVGALWRNAAAFEVQCILLTQDHSPELNGTVAKSACGALEIVPYARVVNLANTLELLKKQGFFCVGLAEGQGEKLDVLGHEPIALIVGSEGKGLRKLTQARCDRLVSIPTAAQFSTLNASSAGSIALWHLFQQRKRV